MKESVLMRSSTDNLATPPMSPTLRCPCQHAPNVAVSFHLHRKIIHCQECHLLVRAQLPSEEELFVGYRDEYFAQFGDEQMGESRSNVYQHALEELTRLQPSKGLLVDVGCGAGTLLGMAEQRGWRGIGFDPSRESVTVARAQGLEAYTHQWPPCPLSTEEADAVTVVNVLDHLRDPFAALQEAWRILRPGGLLYVRVPNGPVHLALKSSLSKIGLGHLAVFHLFGFGKKSFSYHLPRLGFSILTIKTASPSHGESYCQSGEKRARFTHILKTLDTYTHRLFTALGFEYTFWGFSLEVIARKSPLEKPTDSQLTINQ